MIRACLHRIVNILLPQRCQRGQRATRGETITEALVSVLIGGMALLLLAGAISSAFHIITNSETRMDAQYTLNNQIVEGVTTTTPAGSIGFDSGVIIDGSSNSTVGVTYYVYDITGSQAIVTYK